MNIKVTMARLHEIIKEEIDMIDVSDDIVEEDDDESYKIDNAVIKHVQKLEDILDLAREANHHPDYLQALKVGLSEFRQSYYNSGREIRPFSIYK